MEKSKRQRLGRSAFTMVDAGAAVCFVASSAVSSGPSTSATTVADLPGAFPTGTVSFGAGSFGAGSSGVGSSLPACHATWRTVLDDRMNMAAEDPCSGQALGMLVPWRQSKNRIGARRVKHAA